MVGSLLLFAQTVTLTQITDLLREAFTARVLMLPRRPRAAAEVHVERTHSTRLVEDAPSLRGVRIAHALDVVASRVTYMQATA